MFNSTTFPESTNASITGTCGHCGGIHSGMCSRIKAIEYYPDGTMKRVEYHDERSPAQLLPIPWPQSYKQPAPWWDYSKGPTCISQLGISIDTRATAHNLQSVSDN